MDLSLEAFIVARNPDRDSRLPYLLRLPIEGGLILKARDPWPRASRVYCHPYEAPWEDNLEIVDQAPVVLCQRRGAAIDLVLDRRLLARSQFVFTEAQGRSAIFWQTQKAARAATPGARVPRGKTVAGLNVVIDTRERYPFRFSGRNVVAERAALPAGDYAVLDGERVIAAVERKTLEDLTNSLSDGTLGFQMQRLAELALGAVAVEGGLPDVFRAHPGRGAWLADTLARLAVRYPAVQVVFAGSRKFAEEWTYRFLSAALSDALRIRDP
ncbi:MAG: ERCC4 domain-containing protein [Actinomycetota bacterium]